ncbi:hypothetical protein UlMin_023089 [Ulmus minor]
MKISHVNFTFFKNCDKKILIKARDCALTEKNRCLSSIFNQYFTRYISAEIVLAMNSRAMFLRLWEVVTKQGFTMKHGVLIPGCVRLLLHRGTPCFHGYGRRGERRRKSVRGCIVSPDLSVLNLVIVKKGESDLPGLTDTKKPRMRGPKRASKIRKLYNLSKEDDVCKYVNTYRRSLTTKAGKKVSKAPKIQRLGLLLLLL